MTTERKESRGSSVEARAGVHRLTVLGATAREVFEIYSHIQTDNDWYPEFRAAAKRFEQAGDSTEDGFVKASNYIKASLFYHTAQGRIKHDNEEKKQAYLDVARSFQKAGPYLQPPLEVVEYPFMGLTFSAYFRKAVGSAKPPCVIVVRGVDASKETQDHLFCEFLLERGLSTLSIDCPGQQAPRFAGLRMTPDSEKPVGAALDYLETRKDVNLDKIGIVGVSFGAYFALRAASLHKRIKACVSVGGWYDFAEFDRPANSMGDVLNDTKYTLAEWKVKKGEYTLEGIIDQMTGALLLVNGSEDKNAPIEQLHKVYEHARCQKEIKIYPGYDHCAYNQDRRAIVYLAEWLSAQLGGKKGEALKKELPAY